MSEKMALTKRLALKVKKNIYEILPFTFYRNLDTWLRKKILKLDHEDWWYGHVASEGDGKHRYIICRYAIQEFATFAAAIQYAFTANYFRKKGYIPIIDMESIEVFEQNKFGVLDIWGYVFKQDVRPCDVPEDAWVYVDTVHSPHAFNSRDCLEINGTGNDHWIHAKDEDWRAYYQKSNEFVKPIWTLNDEIKANWQNQVGGKLKESDVVLGVALREEFSKSANMVRTEEAKVRYDDHPLVPEVDETLLLVEKQMKLWNCNKIFVSTEHWHSVELFRSYFGEENVICVDRFFCAEQDMIMLHKGNESKLIEANYYRTVRIKDRYSAYATEVWGLSKCHYLIAAKCSGAIAALTFNAGKYRDICILPDANHIERY